MSASEETTEPARKEASRLRSEALDLFMAVQDNPTDIDARQQIDDFMASGPEARRAVQHIASVWLAAERPAKPRARGRRSYPRVLAVAAAFAGIALLAGMWSGAFSSADFSSGTRPSALDFLAGSEITLDAGSAIAREERADAETLAVLDGAAFFDVETRDRPLTVTAGDLAVSVLGTRFSVAHSDRYSSVAVAEGEVKVTWPSGSKILGAGDGLRLSSEDNRIIESDLDPETVAAWRSDKLVVEDRSFAEVVEILDRRISGPVLLVGGELAERRLTAAFSLDKPVEALRAAARAVGGAVRVVPGVAAIVTAG